MKKTIMMILVICLITFSTMAQNTGYAITGNIKGLPDGITFYLIQSKKGGGADTSARVNSKNGQFDFKDILEEEGQLVFVKMDTSVVKVAKDKQSWVRLLLDNSGEMINLTGDLSSWPEVKIDGAKLTQVYEQFNKTIKQARSEAKEHLYAANNDKEKIAEIEKDYNKQFFKNLESISTSQTAPLFIFDNGALEVEQLEVAYNRLSDRQKNSYYGKRIKQKVINTKKSREIGVGKLIPDFQVKSPEGKTQSVRDIAMKSKYTLVDFWASWCVPCRADIPNMKKVYDTFHTKGFNILSVSTDTSLPSWQKALKEENTPWTNGVQKGNVAKDTFGINAIPGYILLNDKAEIVQMDMNSMYFSGNAVGIMGGAQVFLKGSKMKGLRGDDLYEIIEGLLGKSKN